MIYLKTKEEINEWLINHSKNKHILSYVEFSKENEQLIVNCSNSVNYSTIF